MDVIERFRQETQRLVSEHGSDPQLAALLAVIEAALDRVPDCLGVSVTLVQEGQPYTLTASDESARTIDAVQYLDTGPCLEATTSERPEHVPDITADERWHLFSVAAQTSGVTTSLSLPLVVHGRPVGAVNFYGAAPDAFGDREAELTEILSQATRLGLVRTAGPLASDDGAADEPEIFNADIEQATGVLMHLMTIDAADARRRIVLSAARAGIGVVVLAQAIIRMTDPR